LPIEWARIRRLTVPLLRPQRRRIDSEAELALQRELTLAFAPIHKRAFGVGAYVATAVGIATAITRAHVRVETDGGNHEAPAASVLLANCGGLIPFMPPLADHIAMDDGQMDVLVLDAASLPGAARIAWRLFLRRHGSELGITLLRAGWVQPPDDGFFDQSARFIGGADSEAWWEEWTRFPLEADIAP